ncbi:FCD domain-containing protein [Paraburkholderia aromaticivorans]|uniref:FCD domain-containing protein n=1 Tax=Paraburkholderia aromaticivorans TaxID=2026199 RepID=UPI003CC61B66
MSEAFSLDIVGGGSDVNGAEPEPRTRIELAYRRLRRDILDGLLPPGSKLRVEHLKSQYQVGAGTLREAMALLLSDSLVVAQEQKGFRVAPVSMEDLKDLTRTRSLLEIEALKQSIALGDDDWEANLVSAFHKLTLAEERLVKNPAIAFNDWEDRNRQFHEALLAACPSRWLKHMRSILYQQAERYRRLSAVYGPPPTSVHDEHRAIYEAALARDVGSASEALEHHIGRAVSVTKLNHLLDR